MLYGYYRSVFNHCDVIASKAIELGKNAKCRKCLAYFCSEYSRARPSTGRSGQVIDSVCMSQFSRRAWPIRCSRSTVAVAAPARLRPICRTLCTGASLTTNELSAVSYDPLSHSRHNAGDRSTNICYHRQHGSADLL